MKIVTFCLALLLPSIAGASTFCDINGDGKSATAADYVVFFNALLGRDTDPFHVAWADLNRDRAVNTTDYGILLRECPLNVK